MNVKITNWLTGAAILDVEAETLKAALEAAVRANHDLREADLSRANLSRADLSGADLREADLSRANLSRADLSGADLSGADLSGADPCGDLIDGGQERRGYRFWAWLRNDGTVIYRGGCHEWAHYDEGVAHYGEGYNSKGNRDECLARLALMRDEAVRRGWVKE